MRQIDFGRTGERISAIGLGTWPFSGPNTVGHVPVGWSGHDDELASAALAKAFEGGINHWDTADVYGDGHAETLIGGMWDQVPREQVFLASKVGWDAGGHGHYYQPDLIRSRLERSLENLRTERIDLYYLHHCDFGTADEYLDDAVDELVRARKSGKIRFIGLSDWKSDKILRYGPRVDPDAVQLYRNVVDDKYETSGLKAWVEERNLGAVFFSPLKHGLLLGKYTEPTSFGDGDMRDRIPGFRDPIVLDQLANCRREVEKRFPDSAQPVLHALTSALLTDSETSSALVGLRNPSQAEAAWALGSRVSEPDRQWIRDLYRETRK